MNDLQKLKLKIENAKKFIDDESKNLKINFQKNIYFECENYFINKIDDEIFLKDLKNLFDNNQDLFLKKNKSKKIKSKNTNTNTNTKN